MVDGKIHTPSTIHHPPTIFFTHLRQNHLRRPLHHRHRPSPPPLRHDWLRRRHPLNWHRHCLLTGHWQHWTFHWKVLTRRWVYCKIRCSDFSQQTIVRKNSVKKTSLPKTVLKKIVKMRSCILNYLPETRIPRYCCIHFRLLSHTYSR